MLLKMMYCFRLLATIARCSSKPGADGPNVLPGVLAAEKVFEDERFQHVDPASNSLGLSASTTGSRSVQPLSRDTVISKARLLSSRRYKTAPAKVPERIPANITLRNQIDPVPITFSRLNDIDGYYMHFLRKCKFCIAAQPCRPWSTVSKEEVFRRKMFDIWPRMLSIWRLVFFSGDASEWQDVRRYFH